MNDLPKIRVRIAPSPTGVLHMGTARTALFNWLFARKHSGVFVLRIEDTDRERSRSEFEKNIIETLSWLDLDHQEFYRQQERMGLYRKYLEQLLAEGKAFYCAHTKEELEKESEAQRAAKEPPRHVCVQRDQKGSIGIIRFRNDSRETVTVSDIVRGDVAYEAALLGDFSLAKSLDEPLYNFAAVIDDHDLAITHVIRGEDHLPNTPKQILIGRALGFPEPAWAHIPLLLGKDRSKLSKRHGALSVSEYRDQGYLKEAVVNFIALLGWHPAAKAVGEKEREIFSVEELVHEFSLERIQKGGAVVALEKLDWFNKEYIKMLPARELAERVKPFLGGLAISDNALVVMVEALRTRMNRLTDFAQGIAQISNPPQATAELLAWNGKIPKEKLAQVLAGLIGIVAGMEMNSFSKEAAEQALVPLIEKEGKGTVLWPLRAALSGQSQSPGPYELLEIMGKDKSLARLTDAAHIVSTALNE